VSQRHAQRAEASEDEKKTAAAAALIAFDWVGMPCLEARRKAPTWSLPPGFVCLHRFANRDENE